MEFDNAENRLVFPDINSTSLSYAIRCIGYRLSKFYTDTDLNIIGNIVKKDCGVVRVIYKEESYFRYLLLVAISKRIDGNLLYINKIFYEKYGALDGNDASDLCIFDLVSNKIYYFKSNLVADRDYLLIDDWVVFDSSLARNFVDLSGGELFALSMSKDDLFEFNDNNTDTPMAGQLMSNWLPIGIIRKSFMFIFIILGIFYIPKFDFESLIYFSIAMLFSPRLVGEGLYALGRLVRFISGN